MTATLRQLGTLIGLCLIVLFFAIQLPDTFLSARNILNVTQQISMLAVIAFAMTVVMVMNDFDLSVGSMASLAGVVAAVLFAAGYPVYVGVAAALAVGLVGGVFNGFLVAVIGILPFVATLGTLTIFSGLAFFISGGRTIFGRDIPAEFSGVRALRDSPRCDRPRSAEAPGADPVGAGCARRGLGDPGTDDLRAPPLRHRRQYRGGTACRYQGAAIAAQRLRGDRPRRRCRRTDVCQPRLLPPIRHKVLA